MRDVRASNSLPYPGPGRRRRPGDRLFGDRQPLEGLGGPGDPEPEPDARHGRRRRACERAGPDRSFLPLPLGRGAIELDSSTPRQLPDGFRAGSVHCGLKNDGGTDLGLLGLDEPDVSSAVLLTRNAAAAAPIRVCRDSLNQAPVRAVVVNSGNANASTGEQGLADALAMRDSAAAELGWSRNRRRGRNRCHRCSDGDGAGSAGHSGSRRYSRRGRRRRVLGGDHDHRPVAQRCPSIEVSPSRPRQRRRHDRARVRDDALFVQTDARARASPGP